MTTFILLVSVLISGSVPNSGLSTASPLYWWMQQMEACSDELLPGCLPDAGEAGTYYPTVSGYFPGISNLIRERGLSPGFSEDGEIPQGFNLAVGGSVAGEVLFYDDDYQTRLGGTLEIHAVLLPGLFLDEQLSIWTGSDEQPPDFFGTFHEGVEKGRHLYVDWGYLQWIHDGLSVSLGRIPQRWGPGRETQLLLSTNSPALDMLEVKYTAGELFEFTGFTATVQSDSGIYLTAHRLDIEPLPNLRFGLNESILYKADGLDFAYLNPIVPWYPIQWNEREDDNAFLSFDASWKPLTGLLLYGEFLIDDIQYQLEYDRPNKLGYTAGITTAVPNAGLAATLEYTKIDRYVYSQREDYNYYLHHGSIIGSGLGPDADRISLSMGTSVLSPLLIRTDVSHTRHGEGSIEDGWPEEAETGAKFPSGVVEYTTNTSLLLSWYLSDAIEIHTNVSNDWVRNSEHNTGESITSTLGNFEIIYNF